MGSDEWGGVAGTSPAWTLLDGAGNVDDNVLELPDGPYRAVSLRTFEPWSERWSIWWLDGRNPGRLDPPVVGRFKDGVGTFIGDDTFDGQPILVRFLWSDITADDMPLGAGFSPDDGATWEVNWIMASTRIECFMARRDQGRSTGSRTRQARAPVGSNACCTQHILRSRCPA